MGKYFVILSLLWFGCCFAVQQDSTAVQYDHQSRNTVPFRQEDIEPFTQDNDYNYEPQTVDNSWWVALKNWFYNLLRAFFEWLFGVDAAPNYIAVFLKYLPYLLLGILLYLVIRFFLKVHTKNILFTKNNEGSVFLSEEERMIKSNDLGLLLKEAIEQKNYRLAVRYYYLSILKLLSERELIHWEIQKTNDDYIAELSTSSLKNSFKSATILYDYIWYGEFDISHEKFTVAQENFKQLRKSISTYE